MTALPTLPARLRRFVAQTPPDRTDHPPVAVPSWLLVPGLVVLFAALAAYVQTIRYYPISGLDLQMYRGGIQAFLDGKPVYQLGYTALQLPYTYPPITLPLLTPLVWVSLAHSLYAMVGVSMVAALATLWFTTRILRWSGWPGRLGIAAAVTGLAIWTGPFQDDLNLGQINALLLVLIVADLSLSDGNRAKGALIGLATASKLLPGLFVVYLLVTRRIRAALVATATFVVLTAAGWVIQPGGSHDYWLTGKAFDSSRVMMTLGPRYGGNQSLQGFTARLLGTDEPNNPLWAISALVVAVAGLALAIWAQRLGEEALAMVITGFTMLMISPVSWSHYWLWVAPLVLVLADIVRRLRGTPQVVAAGVAAIAILPFMVWPLRVVANGPLMPSGLIWAAYRHSGVLTRLFLDPFVPTTLVLLVLTVLYLRHVARSARTEVDPPDQPAPRQLAEVRAG